MAGAWLWCGLLALASIVLAVPPKIISSTVTIKDAEAAGARVSLAQYNTIVDQDIHVLQMQDCPSLTACPPLDACAPCNYANKTECERIVNPVGQPDQACLETCDPSFCDVDTYGDWEEIALPKTSLIADLGDYDTWPNGVARYRFYIPQGQPYCNMSAFLRASGQGEFSSAPDLMATRVPLESDYDVYNYDRFPWLGGRLYDDQFYICPTDIYPLYTDSYSAGTYFVYVWYSEGACNLTLEMQPIPGPSTEVEDMSWCDATLSTLPPPFQGKTAELLTDGVINATSTVHKCIASDTTYNYVLQDQFRHRLLARVDGPCPRYFGITQVDEQTLVGRNLYLSLTTSAHVTFDDDPPGEIIMEQDFSIRSIFLTFCPANVSEPTYVSAYIQGDGLFRVFYSKNRNRFSAKLLTDFGDEITQVATMSNAVMLAFPDSASVPFCTKLCLYSDDPCSCQDGIESVLARQEVSPLYPLPSWYSVKTALYSPPMPDWLAPSPFVGLRSIPISLLIKSEATIVDRTVPIPLFTEDQIDTSYVFFMGRLSLVNAQLEGFNVDVFHPDNGLAVSRFNSQNCTVASYTSIKGDIDYWVSQLTNTSVSLSLVTYELDALSFREPYVACKNKASSLLRSVAVTRLQDSAGCIVFDLNDPCCADNPEWEVCCVSRPQNVTSVSTSPADDALIGAACPYTSPSCLRTYLSEYTLAEQASCGDVLPVSNKWRFTQCVDDWVDCSDEVFGEQLIGEECVTDADCPSGFCNAPYTPSISLDPLRVLSNPRGPRRVCQEPLRNLTSRFLRCLAQSGSAVFLQVLRAYPAPSLNESIDLMIANLTTRDCVAPAGVALEAGYYQHYGDGEPPCVSACEYQTMGPFIRSTNNCNQGNVATLCGSNYQWNIERDLSECPLRSTCNWYDCVNNHLSNADCNATCLAPSSGVCAICRNDGTCFDDFSTYDASVTDDISCGLSSGCQLANGTIVNLSPAACAATFSCSNPCWDSVAGAYRPCLSEDECMQAGKCSDDNLDNPLYPDDGGSCVFQPRPFYGAICAGSYSEYTYVNSDNVGCIVYDLDKADCLAADRDPQWFPLARTREECEGRCGCLKDTTFFSNWRVDKMISTFPSTPEQCSECAPAQKCEPYHTWTPARWEAGSPRTLKWVTPGLVPAYELRSDAFDWATFVSQWSRTCSFDGPLWRARTLTYNQCRFNRVASSLEAVACGCGTDGSTACSDAVVSSLPIGVGEPCPLVPQTLNIPPHTIEFYATSVPATQGCTSIVAFLVSESAFANSAPSQRLSSYFAPKPQDPKAGEFTNSHSAVVGEVIGDGVLFQFNGTFSSARLCLDVGAFSKVYATLRVDEFPLLDIAYSVGGVVTPLNLVMDIVGDGYCGTIDTLKEGVYVPVIHKYDWENVRQKGLTRGEKSVLALSAALYFVSVAIYPPYYCIQFVRSVGLLGAISVSLFWLPILLAAANILRGVYFALLAAELLSDQTYVDVLLVELPTFIWFTASSLMVLFWLVFLASIWNENSVPRIRRLKRAFWITFFVVNGVMYGLFIAFVVVFSQLKDRIDEEQCLGRLPPHVLRRPKRIAFIVYQSVLAAIALFLAIAHVIAGPLLSRRLHRAAIDKRANSAAYFKLVVVAVIVAIAFALHAIFIFALALTNPGIPYLVLILLVLDLVPTAILLWQLPTPAVISNTSSTSSSGTVGNIGGSGPSSMSASLF